MRSLKVAVEPVGRYNGSVLKRALIISKDLEFNYQFGRDTKVDIPFQLKLRIFEKYSH